MRSAALSPLDAADALPHWDANSYNNLNNTSATTLKALEATTGAK